jgi:hypothetical protein
VPLPWPVSLGTLPAKLLDATREAPLRADSLYRRRIRERCRLRILSVLDERITDLVFSFIVPAALLLCSIALLAMAFGDLG